jgi:PPP family 3-phenylpropionic acid transporter
MFPVTGLLALLAAAPAICLPRGGEVSVRAERGDWRQLLRLGEVLRLLAFTFGAYLFTQGPMAMFPVYVRSLGGDLDMVGRMWVFMLLLEIPLVAFSGPGLRRLGGGALLGIGTAAGGVRWLVCALSSDLRVIYPVQLLHGVVVAGLMIGGALHLDTIVPERLRSTAQSVLSTIGVGVAGILSNIACGWLLDHVGVSAPYLVGGVGALILGCTARWVLKR